MEVSNQIQDPPLNHRRKFPLKRVEKVPVEEGGWTAEGFWTLWGKEEGR